MTARMEQGVRYPGPYVSGMTVEPREHVVHYRIHDPFGTAFKITCGVLAALVLFSVLMTMLWIAIFSALLSQVAS